MRIKNKPNGDFYSILSKRMGLDNKNGYNLLGLLDNNIYKKYDNEAERVFAYNYFDKNPVVPLYLYPKKELSILYHKITSDNHLKDINGSHFWRTIFLSDKIKNSYPPSSIKIGNIENYTDYRLTEFVEWISKNDIEQAFFFIYKEPHPCFTCSGKGVTKEAANNYHSFFRREKRNDAVDNSHDDSFSFSKLTDEERDYLKLITPVERRKKENEQQDPLPIELLSSIIKRKTEEEKNIFYCQKCGGAGAIFEPKQSAYLGLYINYLLKTNNNHNQKETRNISVEIKNILTPEKTQLTKNYVDTIIKLLKNKAILDNFLTYSKNNFYI